MKNKIAMVNLSNSKETTPICNMMFIDIDESLSEDDILEIIRVSGKKFVKFEDKETTFWQGKLHRIHNLIRPTDLFDDQENLLITNEKILRILIDGWNSECFQHDTDIIQYITKLMSF